MLIFREVCLEFVVTLLKKLSSLFLLTSKILRGFSFLDPSILRSQLCVRRMNLLMKLSLQIGLLVHFTDKIKESFLALMKMATVTSACSKFKKGKDRLDSFLIPIFEKE